MPHYTPPEFQEDDLRHAHRQAQGLTTHPTRSPSADSTHRGGGRSPFGPAFPDALCRAGAERVEWRLRGLPMA